MMKIEEKLAKFRMISRVERVIEKKEFRNKPMGKKRYLSPKKVSTE